jgi:hypothetical protein
MEDVVPPPEKNAPWPRCQLMYNVHTVQYLINAIDAKEVREKASVMIMWLCYDTGNATDNQCIIQSTPAIFSFKSWTMDAVITVEKVRARERHKCIGLIFGGLIKQFKEALIVMSVDYMLCWLSIALIVA